MKRHHLAALLGLLFVAFEGSGVPRAASKPGGALPSPGADALDYAKGYLITGNYVASGVDLTEQANPVDQNGMSTGTIHIARCTAAVTFNCVPQDADIVAAYLYFETITRTADLSAAAGDASSEDPAKRSTFRGEKIVLNDLMAVKKSKWDLVGTTASCWSSGVPLSLTMFRVDVLRWLPIRLDKDDKPTGKRLVTDDDLIAHGLPLHQVKLPTRNGNNDPETAGASLVLVYRDPSQPLRKIVLYDGVHVQSSASEVTTQNLRGFYKSSLAKSAQITHILAGGQPNNRERILFRDNTTTDTPISGPDPVSAGSASQRSWATLTYDVHDYMNPATSVSGYGETATTTIDHTGGGYDCLAMSAVVFSTAVADKDGDGIPDGLEDADGGLTDADGKALPNLHAMYPAGHPEMQPSSEHKDLFVEFNSMWAEAGTTYGSATAPYNSTTSQVSDTYGHNHTPTPEMLKMIGDAYMAHQITPHFDVGNITSYHAANPSIDTADPPDPKKIDPKKLGLVHHVDWDDDYTSTVADLYLVPSAYARGGELIKEVACDSGACQFSAFPGTVGWKLGLQIYRDQPVDDDGGEIALPGFDWDAGTHRRRFDRDRFGLFHYVLYAHARGTPKSDLPCLIGGVAGPYDAGGGTSCTTNNPDFHVPTSRSGVADLPGGNLMVTLGLWDDFVGRPYVRASTTFHELGHNLNLWHGGLPAAWGNKHPLSGSPTSTYIEPNCKPNYQSSMSYLFQAVGLFDNADEIHLDYSDRDFSGTSFFSLNETMPLGDVAPSVLYVPAWFAPAANPLAVDLDAPISTRFCDGSKFDPGALPVTTARVHAASTLSTIDWDGNPGTSGVGAGTNVNFDGTPAGVQLISPALYGFNDWTSLRLDQISAGRNAVKFQDDELTNTGSGDWLDFGSGDFTDYGSGDFVDFGSGDFTDYGSGDFTDYGSGVFQNASSGDFTDFGSGDFTDFGSGDFTDFGSGDFLDFGSGTERQELDYEAAKRLGRSSPFALTACIVGQDAGCTVDASKNHNNEVRWKSSTYGHILQYLIQRKKGNGGSANAYVPAGTSNVKSFIDVELPDNTEFTYRVRTEFDDELPHPFSPWSKSVTITAVNNAPTPNGLDNIADSYATNSLPAPALLVGAPGVLLNDTDGDSPAGSVKALPYTGPSAHGGLVVLLADGSFTYTPPAGFAGVDSFKYRANNGLWTDGTPMSPNSDEAEVTITVTDITAPVLTLPGNITVAATSASGAVVTYAASATDNVNGSVPVTCVPSSGSTFPIGTTTVNCSATDATSHTATGSFTVTVTGVTPYAFTGFLSPLVTAANTDGASASTSFSGGTFQLGKAIPIKWRLKLNGVVVTDRGSLSAAEFLQRSSTCAALASPPPPVAIYKNGSVTGNTEYRWDATNQQFLLNADTSALTVKTCYRIRLKLSDGSVEVTDFKFK